MPPHRTPGQRAGLTRDVILEAALALVDREGLRALSMRRLGAELGVEAMTLYHHVPNKDALLDGLVEQVVSRISLEPLTTPPWESGLRKLAHSVLDALLAHPNVIPVVMSRPAVTRRNLTFIESALGMLRNAGFPLHTALDVIYAVAGFVLGHAATSAADEGPDPRAEPGQAAVLVDVDPAEFPLLVQAAREAGQAGTRSRFDFALDAMLSGFDEARTT